MFRLTPVVQQLLILNVIIFIGLMIAPDQINDQYFTLHKLNAFGIHTEAAIDGGSYYVPPGSVLNDGTTLNQENVNQYVQHSPQIKQALKNDFLSAQDFLPLQVITYFFNHSQRDIFHIVFNMLGLVFLGPAIESIFGAKRFLTFYLFCGIFAGLALALLDPSPFPVLGASTAVSGIIVAFAMMYPRQKLIIFPLPFGIEARYIAFGAAAISAILVLVDIVNPGQGGNVSHFGHLMGMVGAVLFFYVERFIPGLGNG